MSKADKMFEELGYKKEEHNYIACGKVIEYHNEINSPFDFKKDNILGNYENYVCDNCWKE